MLEELHRAIGELGHTNYPESGFGTSCLILLKIVPHRCLQWSFLSTSGQQMAHVFETFSLPYKYNPIQKTSRNEFLM